MSDLEQVYCITALKKENRILRKKIESVEREQFQLEEVNQKKEALLRKVIQESQLSQLLLEQKTEELESVLFKIERREEALRLIVEGTASATGENFFRSCTRSLAQVLKVKYGFITEVDETGNKTKIIALWQGNGFAENSEFELLGTPCGEVLKSGFNLFPDSLAKKFPHASTVAILEVESYMGIAIKDKWGNNLGTMGIMDTKPLSEFSQVEESILRIFAARVSGEIERDRTQSALKKSASELELTLKELQNTQTQLLHSEKMSSLGQLVAGIAHEINNPVGFIHSNLAPARDYILDLLELIRLYQEYFPQPPQAVEEHIKIIDLNFVLEDLPKLINSMQVGTERIREIVLSLRNFSRLDEAEIKAVDIHEGIDSTLMILNHRIKGTAISPPIRVIKSYGNLPTIECYSGQLNQVFMNILANAIDELEKNIHNHPEPIINIKTTVINNQENQQNEYVQISISDNGSGMTEEIRSRIFDPFFTTKPVGKGTGMGMSICDRIIRETHQGKLYCNSQLGKGTEFMIEIPIKIAID
ncbi:ATP-binding protein [Brunnivagina elsteri]|uniref:histidine kinase n=1 Tax=Brunnivagina elsteri CCALA 953 TaxID=987040 RepID=A0A2A2TMV5_9CYAN|nr:ATP-binding protein [Calothrix elsteri]PAX59747.1 ATPase [Calothrix elsteri CCALA 953]